MRLVAQARDHHQRLRVARQEHIPAFVVRHDDLLLLRETDRRHVGKADLREPRPRRPQLRDATVTDIEIRPGRLRGERRVGTIPPQHDLAHRTGIVGALEGLDLEMTIVASIRQSIHRDHQ